VKQLWHVEGPLPWARCPTPPSCLRSFPAPQPPTGLTLRLCPSPGPFAPTRPPCAEQPCWREGSRAWPAPARPRGPYLVIQHEQQRAFHIDVAGTLHLEAIGLLGCGQPVPLQETKVTLVSTRTSHSPSGFVSAARSGEQLGLWQRQTAWIPPQWVSAKRPPGPADTA